MRTSAPRARSSLMLRALGVAGLLAVLAGCGGHLAVAERAHEQPDGALELRADHESCSWKVTRDDAVISRCKTRKSSPILVEGLSPGRYLVTARVGGERRMKATVDVAASTVVTLSARPPADPLEVLEAIVKVTEVALWIFTLGGLDVDDDDGDEDRRGQCEKAPPPARPERRVGSAIDW